MATNLSLGRKTKGVAAKSPVLQGRRGNSTVSVSGGTVTGRNKAGNVPQDAIAITGSQARGAKLTETVDPQFFR